MQMGRIEKNSVVKPGIHVVTDCNVMLCQSVATCIGVTCSQL